MNVTYKGYMCDVSFAQYGNGNNAIQLIGSEGTDYEGELVGVASVNGELKLEDDVVGIKTWSENEGIDQSLIDGGVIEPELLGLEPTGFVAIEHYKLTAASLEEIEKLKEVKS
ncbi:hypothetical protein ACFSTA_12370 [Ornithinibacillus salinisoli]|uniref:Phage protein n=1 Tax=Ornithinibacillus salinisoli TaxID=1848459 RepID=A0ABW4W3C3_9BACI